MTAKATRITGLAGLASFGLIIVAALVSPPLWDAPATTAPAQEIADYVQDNRGRILAGLFIYSLAIGLFLCFTAGLWAWLRESEAPPHPLSATFAFGAIALATLILAAFAAGAVGTYRSEDLELLSQAQEDLTFALNDLTFGLLALSGIPTAVCLGAYAALVLRSRRLPAWTAWLAAVGAAAHIVIAASFLPSSGFFSLEGDVIIWVPATFFAWILAASMVLLRAGREAPSRA